ncbi:MAG: Phenylacetic acid catabolic protein, partial [Pseudomonadota bacterium]|nr:Phenylacetic acid catabolic protein [Pseudomonadota bacterium]
EFFDYDDTDRRMVEIGACPNENTLRTEWLTMVEKVLEEAGLKLPESQWEARGGRQGVHTEHMGRLLAEMQVLQRRYPALSW